MKSVFISSTFKDMQAERDYLHERIFPQLRKVIGAYGEDICELDLRWGVDTSQMTEEESSHQVLRVCIDAIDRCRPYILVLLGERYGWIPDQALVHSLRDDRIENWYEDRMSITNLEILYGALSEEETLKQCIFCFRDPDILEQIDEEKRPLYASESDLHRKKLDELKALIRSKEGAVILDYTASWDSQAGCITGLEDFGRSVYEMLSAMIRRDFGTQMPKSLPEQMHLDVIRTQERYLSAYVPRYAEEGLILNRLWSHCDHRSKSLYYQWSKSIIIKGEPGGGKSALMASLAASATQSGQKVICYFAGNAGCQSTETLESYVAFRLEVLFGLDHPDSPAKERILQAYEQIKDTPVLIFIDGLDQLFGGASQGFLDLLQLCPNFYYVLSVLSDFDTTRLTEGYVWGFETVPLNALNAEQKKQLVALSAQKRGKKLDDIVTDMVIREPGADNPLYLSLLLQRFFMMDRQEFEAAEALSPGMEGLHLYMRRLLHEMPDEPLQMVRYLLMVVGQRFELHACREILLLLAVSRAGLTEKELEETLALADILFLPLPFQQMVSYLYDSFTQDAAGRWSFSHRLILEAVTVGATEEEKHWGVDLLQRYALQNKAFLKSEGYYQLLSRRHPGGYLVFEQCSEWPNKETVRGEICRFLEQSDAFADYYLDMVKNHPSETLALFWRQLNADFYGAKADECRYALLKAWLDGGGLSPDAYRELLMTLGNLSLYHEEPSVLEHCQKKLLALTEDLPAGQRSLWRARLALQYAWRYEFDQTISFEETCRTLTDTRELLSPLLADEDEILRTEAVYETVKIFYELSRAQSWYAKPCDPELLLQACGLTAGYPDRTGELDFEFLQIELYIQLSIAYGKKPYFDSAKRIEAAKKAVALARKRSGRGVSVSNLGILISTLGTLSRCYKKGFHLEYKEEILRLSRMICSLTPSDYGRRQLACSLCHYAEEACAAESRSFSKAEATELDEKAKHSWNEGFKLFEQSADIHSSGGRPDYAYCLTTCAEVEHKRGYYSKAQTHALKALELLAAWDGKDSDDLFPAYVRDLSILLALIALEHCRSRQAEEYASKAFQAAKIREATAKREYSNTEKAAWLLLESLYQQRKDKEALSLCGELSAFVDGRVSDENSWRKRLIASIFHIRARLAFEKEEFDSTRAYLEKMRPLCDPANDEDWNYGRLLILEAELAEQEPDISKETVSKNWTTANSFWNRFKQLEEYRYTNWRFYTTRNKNGKIVECPSRKESGRYALCDFYNSYTLCRRMAVRQDWSATRVLDHTDGFIDQWELLPLIRPAYAHIRALVPAETLAGYLPPEQDLLTPTQLLGETDRLSEQLVQKSYSPDECLSAFLVLFKKLLKAYDALSKRQESWNILAKRFNRPEMTGQKNPLIIPALTALFSDKEDQFARIWQPLLSLCLLFWERKEALCETARGQLVTILHDILYYSMDDVPYYSTDNTYRLRSDDFENRYSVGKLDPGILRMLYDSINIQTEVMAESVSDRHTRNVNGMRRTAQKPNLWWIVKNCCTVELAVHFGDKAVLSDRLSQFRLMLQQKKIPCYPANYVMAGFMTQLIFRGYELYSEEILAFLKTAPAYIERCGLETCRQVREALAEGVLTDLPLDKKENILQILQLIDREVYSAGRKKLLSLSNEQKFPAKIK